MANETITPHQTTIEPPEGAGWVAHSPHGSQRFKEGPDGLVVRLADVVRWLMQAREMAFADAVRAVCAPLESDSPPLVYRLDPIEKPAPEDQPSEWFKLLPDWRELGLASLPPSTAWARAAAADIRASWLMAPRDLERLVNAPGYPTEYDGTKETPFEFSERADRTGGPKTLAVTFAAAHALWGWGTVAPTVAVSPFPLADWRALVEYRKANDRSSWGAGNQVAIGLAEMKRRVDVGQTESDALEAMAKEIGLSGRESLRKPLKLPAADRKRVNKAAPATPVIKVKDGRKVA